MAEGPELEPPCRSADALVPHLLEVLEDTIAVVGSLLDSKLDVRAGYNLQCSGFRLDHMALKALHCAGKDLNNVGKAPSEHDLVVNILLPRDECCQTPWLAGQASHLKCVIEQATVKL